MGVMEIIVGVVMLLIAVGLIGAILMQEGKGGMGALTGEQQSESFGRNAGKTLGATLKVVTKYGIIALMVLIVVINIMVAYL